MKKFAFGLVACGLATLAACGDNFASEAENKAVDGGKTTVSFERREAAQTTSMDDVESIQRALFVYRDDSLVKNQIVSGRLTKQEGKDSFEVRIRNLDGKREEQTYYASRGVIVGLPTGGRDSGLESGFIRYQSDLSSSYIDLSQRNGKLYSLASQQVTAEEFKSGVRVDFTVVDGEVKSEVKR